MANVRPPSAPAGTPAVQALSAGTVLHRLHQKLYPATAFNPTNAHRYYGGGRFDATLDDSYGYAYLGSAPEVAAAEALLRDLPVDAPSGQRILRSGALVGRQVSPVATTTDLQILYLTSGAELGAVSQDTWLTTAPPSSYAQTRHWGHWIRSHAPDADGFCWRSLREPSGFAYVLFGDRCPTNVLGSPAGPGSPWPAHDFDLPAGVAWLDMLLVTLGVERV